MNLTIGMLYVVATPIGNLDDLSPRARQVLSTVSLIAAEDTRRTGRLLSHFGIKARQVSLHEHNEQEVAMQLVDALIEGASVALVSDAGTPLVSDPGFRLVRLAHERGVRVSPIPGPSAAVAALSAAGLPTNAYCFEGFLPSRQKARQERLQALSGERRTMIFYESVHRIEAAVADMAEVFGDSRGAFIARELSKLHEQCVTGTLAGLTPMFADGRIPAKGEFVVVVAGNSNAGEAACAIEPGRLLSQLLPHLPGKKAVEITAAVTGQNRNSLYRLMLSLSGSPQ